VKNCQFFISCKCWFSVQLKAQLGENSWTQSNGFYKIYCLNDKRHEFFVNWHSFCSQDLSMHHTMYASGISAAVFIKASNPDLQPNMAGVPSKQSAHKFLYSMPCSSKKSDTTLKNISCSHCSFQRSAKQKVGFYIITVKTCNVNEKLD
jgi:hypothetical protein